MATKTREEKIVENAVKRLQKVCFSLAEEMMTIKYTYEKTKMAGVLRNDVKKLEQSYNDLCAAKNSMERIVEQQLR